MNSELRTFIEQAEALDRLQAWLRAHPEHCKAPPCEEMWVPLYDGTDIPKRITTDANGRLTVRDQADSRGQS